MLPENQPVPIEPQTWDHNRDYHSFANSDQVQVAHLSLSLKVDFVTRRLQGNATLSLRYLESQVGELWLDSRDLHILSVTTEDEMALAFHLEAADEILGQKLVIQLPQDQCEQVCIRYHTSPEAEGLQWLTPEQTAGKALPYLFSQSQPINARSWIPLQDTPKVRITFDAHVEVPKGMRAVMSAMNAPETPLEGQFQFEMEKPIPTHLLALAVGDLAFQAIGPRSGVYTEPCMLEAAATEFADTEHMLDVAQSLLGPYAWGRYDMIILPPSFPFGGMENPRLAFLTPTLIAGDKSLVSTVAHELAHSWTGNLVSNATWRDLWLNEGFTTYFTNRIVEAVYGKEQAELEWVIEFGRLTEEMAMLPRHRQTLPANVQQADPNLAFNRFTYDKASMFVHELEHRLGRVEFDKFLFAYVQHFAFKAITTEVFVEYAKVALVEAYPDKISEAELLEWIYGEGLPQGYVGPTSRSLDKVDSALDDFLQGKAASELKVKGWRVHHWQYFLTQLPEVVSQVQLMDLDDTFKFTESTNAEIACDWFRVAIRNHYDPVLPALSAYLQRIGRGKFVRPLYAELQVAGYHAELQQIYACARAGYHPSIQVQLDRMLKG
ncbi:M1 family metallopeptidase [Shewanella seohaensis]|uniref:M1 family metallopeptidase n=1 Tax=Shewanella seohaensis TaxID=755175 RepID=UPI00200EE9C3|nr:M1 family metallopeptidase [Shewanella seohaensis]MCL1119431.1 M1 family metallopeptidase [Shewanella seohaensis]UXM83563.1 M1 family metallopeptidase [Shewanella seohaensis]